MTQFHNTAARDGVYVDARITAAAAGTMHADTTFGNQTLMGPTYAQPLYLAGANGGADLVLVATAQNHVYALDATTGLAGTAGWDVTLGAPMGPGAPGTCGSPLNPLGITGTPVIDATSRTIFLDAMTTADASPHAARAGDRQQGDGARGLADRRHHQRAAIGRHRVHRADPESARRAGAAGRQGVRALRRPHR